MIKKSNKLSSKEIEKKPKTSIRGGILTARIFHPLPGKTSTFSFSVPKKLEKSAVLRNKFKRMGFSVVEKFIGSGNPYLSVHFIFNKRPSSREELEKEISSLLNQAKLIK